MASDFLKPGMRRIKNTFPVGQQLGLLLFVMAVVFGSAVIPKVLSGTNSVQTITPVDRQYQIDRTQNQNIVIPPLELDEEDVLAKTAYVWDVREQRALFSKSPDTVRPLASITKLMTALVASEIVTDDGIVTVPMSAIKQEGVSSLYDGEKFSRASLSDFMMISSSNDGAYALAASVGELLTDNSAQSTSAFVTAMNIKAEELSLPNTTFKNPTGLDVSSTESGSYSTARETTFLMEYVLENHPDILAATQQTGTQVANESGQLHSAANTNLIVKSIPNLIGSKTGYTDLAGGNLVVAYDAGLNRPIIVTVLGSSRSGRFKDVQTLITAVQDSLLTKE